jgi:hypothetical protein
MKSVRTKGAVLVGRRDGEYWFISSVFKHADDFAGCTGMIVVPVSEEQVEEMLSAGYLESLYGDVWHDIAKHDIQLDCDNCAIGPDEAGCEDCGYQSLSAYCSDIAHYDGLDAVTDYPGDAYKDALRGVVGELETVDCSGCGRIFGDTSVDDFDEVYNRKALVACLAYEDGAVSYDYACRIIFGE